MTTGYREWVQIHIVGPGRAGRSLGIALQDAGWPEPRYFGRGEDLGPAGRDADMVVIATPDDVIAEVASALPHTDALVVHLAGSRGLGELGDRRRVGALHPLVALPDPQTGAARLVGAWFATAGDEAVQQIVDALAGRSFTVADADRARYHAAAVVASNHLVALLGQVEVIAAGIGVPFDALLDLADGSLANVRALGPAAALTGPAARGDEATIRRHLAALGDDERTGYEALAAAARRLAGRPQPLEG
ncbi:MAG: DUF2520 domain-containing protein [Acidimicrobiales bacterium]